MLFGTQRSFLRKMCTENYYSKYIRTLSSTETYFAVSLIYIIINLLTLQYIYPWVDEVMFQDVVWHWNNGDGWTTYAWYDVGGGSFSYYPPLYQMLLAVWMKVFGTSVLACRSINLLFFFALGFVMLKLTEKLNHTNLNAVTTIIFSVLLWGGCELSRMYRQGRPDILMAMLVVLVMYYYYQYIVNKKNRVFLILISALVVMSGFPPCIPIVLTSCMTIVCFKEYRRQAFIALLYILCGFFVGLLLVFTFFMLHHQVVYFVMNTVSYSALLSKIYNFVYYHIPVPSVFYEIKNPSTIKESYIHIIFSYFSFVVLLVVSSVMLILSYKRIKLSLYIFLFVSALLIPLFMSAGGRYAMYYRWMMYLPMLMCFILLIAKNEKMVVIGLISSVICSGIGMASYFYRIPHTDWINNRTVKMDVVNTFIYNLPIERKDHVACPFLIYYVIHDLTPNAYFMNLEGFSKRQDYDFVIVNKGEIKEWGKEDLQKLLSKYENSEKYKVTLIDRLQDIDLCAYKITRLDSDKCQNFQQSR